MPTFTTDTRINASMERCFDLARSVDLHTQSSRVQERAVAGKTSGLLELGDQVTWEARHFGKRQRLSARIVEFDRPKCFSVEMITGAFASHTHTFTFTSTDGNTTDMHEVFQFQSPLGILGWIADKVVLTRYLKRFMRARNAFLKERAEEQ
ncbi:MAG TPA: SRPBCC family protein [Chloroflexota bacterium]|nr:SRPBCC family protein [Chloroflexota bacterium]